MKDDNLRGREKQVLHFMTKLVEKVTRIHPSSHDPPLSVSTLLSHWCTDLISRRSGNARLWDNICYRAVCLIMWEPGAVGSLDQLRQDALSALANNESVPYRGLIVDLLPDLAGTLLSPHHMSHVQSVTSLTAATPTTCRPSGDPSFLRRMTIDSEREDVLETPMNCVLTPLYAFLALYGFTVSVRRKLDSL
ncbi:hypothetical protein J6590_097709 [Homalodisca vitripennis]|nr:hypothetical protein J6590_055203 [Homalodisca vitripennis]KAG8334100.1 hypothetical protein J6590_097709 [Homalodisca vitripennis]